MDLGLNLIKILLQKQFDGAAHAEDLCYYFQWVIKLYSFRLYFERIQQLIHFT